MFRKLLVPLDRSPLAEQAVGQAAAIARASHAEIDLILVHQPLPFAGFSDEPWNAEQWNDEEKYLEWIAGELTSGASIHATHSVLRGEAVDMICKRAWEVDADLIVMTSHGRTGLSRAWLGSVADGVLRHSAVPVLMLRPVESKADRLAAHHLFEHILVPLDGSALAADIISSASALGRCSGARVTLLRVVQPVPLMTVDVDMSFTYPPFIQDDEATQHLVEEAKQQLDEMLRRLAEETGVKVDAHVVVSSRVAQAIMDFASGHAVDAIAMSTHGRGASRFLLGSVADKVLRGSALPMLIHRPIGVTGVVNAPGASNTSSAPPLDTAAQ
jgi:nucleotide-binding universal stress UspA family protein